MFVADANKWRDDRSDFVIRDGGSEYLDDHGDILNAVGEDREKVLLLIMCSGSKESGC